MTSVSPTVGASIVGEFVFKFTHSSAVDWMIPGIAPTGRSVEVPMVAIVRFQGDKLVHEHTYWDQASVLVPVDVLDPKGLPMAGAETTRKVMDKSLPSNVLLGEAWRRSEGEPI